MRQEQRKGARLLLCAIAVPLLLGGEGFAATLDRGRDASNSGLQWGRPQVARPSADLQTTTTANSEVKIRLPQRQHAGVMRDARVVATAWQEDEALVLQAADGDRRLLRQPSAPTYDPFDEDDRLAQLPDDPFDEPSGESIPVPEPQEGPAEDSVGGADEDADVDTEDDINVVEDALQQEIQRRQSDDDLFDDKLDHPLDSNPFEERALDGPSDEFKQEHQDNVDETDSLDDDMDVEDILQSTPEDWKTPDLGLDFEPSDGADGGDVGPTPEELAERAKELAREQSESEANCREELEEIEADRISSIDLSIRVDGNAGEDFPYECAVSTKRHQPRQWPQITYNWKAAALCHKPLYFEQVQLERYGHSWGPYVQPIMSGVHFFGTLPLLPYKMGIRTPTECVYTLGYYRPGSCAPYMIDPVPFTWRAALFQGGVVTGVAAAVP